MNINQANRKFIETWITMVMSIYAHNFNDAFTCFMAAQFKKYHMININSLINSSAKIEKVLETNCKIMMEVEVCYTHVKLLCDQIPIDKIKMSIKSPRIWKIRSLYFALILIWNIIAQ